MRWYALIPNVCIWKENDQTHVVSSKYESQTIRVRERYAKYPA